MSIEETRQSTDIHENDSHLTSGFDDHAFSMHSMPPPNMQLQASSSSDEPTQKPDEGQAWGPFEGKWFTNMFHDGREGRSYEVHILVDQPGEGGDRDTWEWTRKGVEVGHTFMKLVRHNPKGMPTTSTFGFYPTTNINPVLGPTVAQGSINADEGHPFDYKYREQVDKKAFYKIIEYVELHAQRVYMLDLYNCTDFVIQAMAAGGVNLPDSIGKWHGGGGSNPGMFADDLLMHDFLRRYPPGNL